MRMYDIIDKKKKGMELTADEISYVVDGYVQTKYRIIRCLLS